MESDLRQYLRDHRARFERELAALLRFPSVSAQPAHRRDLVACARWIADHFKKLGLATQLHATRGNPILEARTPRSPRTGGRRAPTVLIYGHYDVQPPDPLAEWKTPPFRPQVRAGRIYARGASDNKGQFFAHVKAVEAYLRTGTPLPADVIFLIEGEEEVGSSALMQFVKDHARRLRTDTIVVSDGGMYSPEHPTLSYATRGAIGLEIQLDGPSRDLHSGVFGGSVANPALALARLLAGCVGADGHVAIPGFYEGVRPIAAWERRAWRQLPFDAKRYRDFLGVPVLAGERGYTPLEQCWARPTFEINGLTSGYQGAGGKTIVPARASAKLSCRLVPDQDPATICRAVERHLRRQCPKSVRLRIVSGHVPWFFNAPDGPGARAALAALEQAFGKKPVLTREGGTLPILDVFRRHLGAEILLLGLGLSDDNWHAPNEKMDLRNFHGGIALGIELIDHLSKARRAGAAS